MKGALFLHLTIGLISCAYPFKTNVTNFGNCDGVLDTDGTYPVEVYNIQYENVDGFVRTMHGNYKVRAVDTREKELLITIFQCPGIATGQCRSNEINFTEQLHCEQFKGDNSGIWYMISSAMSGSHCGETEGEFKMENITLRNEYLEKYLSAQPQTGRYYLQMLFYKKAIDGEKKSIRGCLSMDFDIL